MRAILMKKTIMSPERTSSTARRNGGIPDGRRSSTKSPHGDRRNGRKTKKLGALPAEMREDRSSGDQIDGQ